MRDVAGVLVASDGGDGVKDVSVTVVICGGYLHGELERCGLGGVCDTTDRDGGGGLVGDKGDDGVGVIALEGDDDGCPSGEDARDERGGVTAAAKRDWSEVPPGGSVGDGNECGLLVIEYICCVNLACVCRALYVPI